MATYKIHIGYGKTGTTTLQQFLSDNRNNLTKASILYPDILMDGTWLGVTNHNQIGRAIANKLGWWKKSAIFYFKQIEQQRIKVGAQTVILSGESFIGANLPWEFSSTGEYWTACERAIEVLASNLQDHSVEIYVYLRRQDKWLESAINQTIKYGGLQTRQISQLPYEEIAHCYKPRLDYLRVLNMWESGFGKANLHVGLYEKNFLLDNDIVPDFLHLAKIDLGQLTRFKHTLKQKNIRISRDILEVKHQLNQTKRPKYQERVLVDAIHYAASKLKKEQMDTPILPHTYCQSLMDKYEIQNLILKQKYLPHLSRNFLFSPVGEDKIPNVYAGLENDNQQIIHDLIQKYMRSFHARRSLLRHFMAENLRSYFPKLHARARQAKRLAWFIKEYRK